MTTPAQPARPRQQGEKTMTRAVEITSAAPSFTRSAPLASVNATSVEEAAHAWAEERGSIALINYRSGLYAVHFELLNGEQFIAEDIAQVAR